MSRCTLLHRTTIDSMFFSSIILQFYVSHYGCERSKKGKTNCTQMWSDFNHWQSFKNPYFIAKCRIVTNRCRKLYMTDLQVLKPLFDSPTKTTTTPNFMYRYDSVIILLILSFFAIISMSEARTIITSPFNDQSSDAFGMWCELLKN